MLGEKYMPTLDESQFWELANILVDYNRKAFLVTVLHSWLSRKSAALSSLVSATFFQSLRGNTEDQKKTVQILLPTLTSVDEIEWLLSALQLSDPRTLIAFYLQNITLPSGFLLLKTLRQVEDDRALLIRTTYYLMKKGDGLSFNLASLIRSFFGLDEVKGTFSLIIQPYELARLSSDYDAYLKKIQAI